MAKKTLKSLISMSLIIATVFATTGCNSDTTNKAEDIKSEDKRILEAINILEEKWSELYDDYDIFDKYVKIANTRIVNVKDKPEIENPAQYEYFDRIDYFIDFTLITNYYDSSPHYMKNYIWETVVVLEDGSMEVFSQNPLVVYRTSSYSNDFTGIIDSIEEFDAEYNGKLTMG